MSEPTPPTITPTDAAALHEGADGTTAGPWTRVGEYHYDTGRWTERWWLVITDADGALWEARYEIGLTEDQENNYPRYGDDAHPAPLTRLYPHTVTQTVYRTRPPEGPAPGAALTPDEVATGASFLRAYLNLAGRRVPDDHPVRALAAKLAALAPREGGDGRG